MQEIDDNTASKQAKVTILTDEIITINGKKYRLVENHENGFDEEKIEERFNTVLDKFDYVVGDWGYDQLRFKGFYDDQRPESGIDNKISHLEDYLIEFCNFGCSYFVLEKENKPSFKKRNSKKPNRNNRKPRKKRPTNAAPHHNHNNNNTNKKARPNTNNRRKRASTSKFKIRKIGENSK
ncbi:YutD family protein [Companilactobacillus kedongensis]|uniref:YutD family protein n=1 Tax=Companilactobacillus kedongensis TaxID=2486004 RepID=UPI001CDD8937|nr:YutD family protein [Companilactobacillus kedongensis]